MDKWQNARASLAGVWTVPLVIAADRLTKAWSVASLRGRGSVPALPGLLNWRYAENTGAAFSALSGQTWLLSLLTLVLIAAVVGYLLLRRGQPVPLRLGLWLVAAGGLSNLYDRLVYGYVVDFIEFAFVRFAVFNLADVGICQGTGLAVLGYALLERRTGREKERSHV